ncbi:YraN family protein [Gulosibacter molinativorax]|uniref:UPF0102 protein C7K25_11625 n=1 Tax=Gulosibacter molinativorax TaxID=256821 RepID=A0ABT7CA22_9MICO|nr:YraN family protein [Gulosibacter molinativorax]MDJ1372010.1 YraN family protein [Gulosibacter molinativorax]QUY60747.1 Unknown protein [Gulosibacter molinativorax]
MGSNVELGRTGEALAARYFESLGYEILERNWRCADGEIDLVVRDGQSIVCVEVKTRRSLRAGHPLEAITQAKLGRMRRVAVSWVAAHPEYRGALRLDVVSIVLAPGAEPALIHVEGVGDLA